MLLLHWIIVASVTFLVLQMLLFFFRSNTSLQEFLKINGAGIKIQSMWMLALRMWKGFSLFKRVIGSTSFPLMLWTHTWLNQMVPMWTWKLRLSLFNKKNSQFLSPLPPSLFKLLWDSVLISCNAIFVLFLHIKLQKGSQHICIETPGLHELHFVNSCIFFGSSPMKIDTSNASVWCLWILSCSSIMSYIYYYFHFHSAFPVLLVISLFL